MANKTIPALPDYGSQDSDKIRKDLLEITKNDGTYASPSYPTGATRKITVEDLKTALAITSQTVTNGVTTKSPSEDAVFDAIYAKGLVKSNAWKNNGVGTFTLEADKYNIVNYSNTNIEILLPAVEVDKTIIVQGTTQDGSGAVNFTINNIKIGGADLGTPYSVTVTNEKEVLIFYGNYYGWHLIGHSNKNIDLSTKLDLDGGNANQDIDIDGFSLKAKHVKVNGTAGAGHISLKHQSANITANANESSIGADSVGDPVWKNDGGAIDNLELQSNKTGTVTGNEASTSKYLTVKGVYDWAVGLFAPKASPTFTGTVTTPDIVVSGATVNTIAHFDATKNIESLPLATYPNLTELSYVKGVTSAIQTQINAKLGGSGLTTNKLLTFNGTNVVSIAGMQLNSTWGQMFGYQGTVGSGGQIFSVLDVAGVKELLTIKDDGSLVQMNSVKHYFGSNGVGQIKFDRLQAGGNLMSLQGVDALSTNYMLGLVNSATSIYGFRYSNDLVAYWQSVNTTASTKISRWANSANTQVALLQNDGLYLGTGTKSASAVLQADSTTQGFLPPRMTNTQRTNIVSPAIGLMVYCTDTIEGLYIYKSTGWTFII